jgi:hypothetical protein
MSHRREADMAAQGQTLRTRDHQTIQQWAEAHRARPATVPGTEHEDHLGVLRFDFPDYRAEGLTEVSWDDWFGSFDERDLEFVYQESTEDGRPSDFFRLADPEP